jgi:hypothetical protein
MKIEDEIGVLDEGSVGAMCFAVFILVALLIGGYYLIF